VSQLGRDALIVDALRTPVGKGRADVGYYRNIHPADLLGRCLSGLIDRSGVDAEIVENIVIGCVCQIAEQSTGIGRIAWLQEGLPKTTGATTVDIRCGSGQQAIHLAALQIAAGVADVVVAGGVEHMGRVGFPVNEAAQQRWGRAFTPQLLERYDLVPQGLSAELIADQWQITRQEMDEFAARSHRLAAVATEEGQFAREVITMQAGSDSWSADQGIRSETSVDGLAALKPAFRDDGRVTAGNSSQISDGAATVLMMSGDAASKYGLRPRAKVLDQVVLGVDPVTMLTGPIPATAKILERNGLKLSDIDLVEINEAFASVVIAWAREHEPDLAKVNVRGGAIALGHPLGATGARLITTLVHALEDLDGELGLVTMCCGGGLGTATLIQRM
jgi:acetyl-CoA acetyltransferase family protein